jgi:hypothetical protein
VASKTYWYENKWEKDKKVTPKADKKPAPVAELNVVPIPELNVAPIEEVDDKWKDEEKDIKWKNKEKNNKKSDIQGEGQLLVERRIVFNPPDKDVVLGVETISKDVEVTEVEIAENIAIVRGTLIKNIIYKTVKREDMEKALNLEKEEEEENNEGNEAEAENSEAKNSEAKNKENNEDNNNNRKGAACESVMPESIAIDGVVRHTTVRIPFEFIIDLPGALPNYDYEIMSKNIRNDLGGQYIYDEETVYKTANADIATPNFIAALIEKDIVQVTLRVFESII